MAALPAGEEPDMEAGASELQRHLDELAQDLKQSSEPSKERTSEIPGEREPMLTSEELGLAESSAKDIDDPEERGEEEDVVGELPPRVSPEPPEEGVSKRPSSRGGPFDGDRPVSRGGHLDQAAFREAMGIVNILSAVGDSMACHEDNVDEALFEMVEKDVKEQEGGDDDEDVGYTTTEQTQATAEVWRADGDQSSADDIPNPQHITASEDSTVASIPHQIQDPDSEAQRQGTALGEPMPQMSPKGSPKGSPKHMLVPPSPMHPRCPSPKKVSPAPHEGHDMHHVGSSGAQTMDLEEGGPSLCWQACRYVSTLTGRLADEGLKLLGMLVPFTLWLLAEKRSGKYPIWELLIPLAMALVGARFLIVFFFGLINYVNLACFPLPSKFLLLLAGWSGWPITVLVWVLALPLLDEAPWEIFYRWLEISQLETFWDFRRWLIVCATSRGCLEVSLQIFLNGLTLKHYKARVQSAVTVQTTIQKLNTIARTAERSSVKYFRGSLKGKEARDTAVAEAVSRFEARSEAPTPRLPRLFFATGRLASERLRASLNALASGPMKLDEAESLDEARKTANRAFCSLVKIQGRARGDGLSRVEVLKWLRARRDGPEAEIFPMDPIHQEDFVAVVVRAYKERRFITAALSSFDTINSILKRFFVGFWAVLMLATLAFLFAIDFQNWIVPLMMSFLGVYRLLNLVLADLSAGAVYVLWTRPFDIGDWIKCARPGDNFDSSDKLMVRDISLWRTTFLSNTGVFVTIQNHVLNSMCVMNVTRSGSCSVPFKLHVPSTSTPEKITELVDSIGSYLAEVNTVFQSASLNVGGIDHRSGYLELSIFATLTCQHRESGPISKAKTQLMLFVHAYMQAAGFVLIRPVKQVKMLQDLPEVAVWS